jgi:DNA repair protein RadC
MHFSALGRGSARFGVPREKKGQKRRNTMRQKRAPYNKTLKETAEISFDSTQLTFPGLYDHIPVYHIELVCDRQVKFENRRSIHNSDDVVALLKDELLRSDREKLLSILLNTKNMVIGIEVVSIGSLNTSVAHPRLCCRE